MFSLLSLAPSRYSFWLDLAAQSTLVLTGAASLAWLLRRSSATVRHTCWMAALFGLVALPMASLVPSGWRIHLVAPGTRSAATLDAAGSVEDSQPAETPPPAALESLVAAAPPSATPVDAAPRLDRNSAAAIPVASIPPHGAAPRSGGPRGDARALVAGVWLAGCALALMPMPLGALSLWRLSKRSCQPTDVAVSALLDDLRREMNLRRRVRVVETDLREMPMTWGVWRPRILLPREARRWTSRQQELVLRHELAHIARCDCLWQVLAQIVRAAYWFQPLTWIAVARMRDEQEHACDDRVLAARIDAADYAEQLLRIASQSCSRRLAPSWVLAMGRPGRIEGRLRSILAAGDRRAPVGRPRLAALTCAIVCLAIIASLPTLRAVAADSPSDQNQQAGQRRQSGQTGTPANQQAKEDSRPNDVRPAANTFDDSLKQLETVRARIMAHYPRPVDEQRLTEGAIKGMVRALDDPYSEYLAPDQWSDVERQLQSQLTGIGARLESKDGQIVVTSPLAESPALKAGIQPGDVLVAVDGVAVNEKPLAEVVKLILGPAGSEVKLIIRRGETDQTLSITRQAIRLPTLRGLSCGEQKWNYWLDATEKIAYVSIDQFAATTAAELRAVLDDLSKSGLRGLVLDLRFSPGGVLSAAVDVASLFLKDAVIVSSHVGKSEQVFRSKATSPFADLPLVVLIGRQTASSSEIVAGALQDNGRAVLLGTRTFGKGSVQMLVKLPETGGLKVTAGEFILPGGRAIDRRPSSGQWGIDPTDGYHLSLSDEQAEKLEALRRDTSLLGGGDPGRRPPVDWLAADPQASAAVNALRTRMATGKFAHVELPNAALNAQRARREEIERRRRELTVELARLKHELAELDKLPGGTADTDPRKEGLR